MSDPRVHFVSQDAEDAGSERATACGALPTAEPSSDLARVTCCDCLRALLAASVSPVSVEGEGEREALRGLVEAIEFEDAKPRTPEADRRMADALDFARVTLSAPVPSREDGRCQCVEGEGKRCTDEAGHGGPHTFLFDAVPFREPTPSEIERAKRDYFRRTIGSFYNVDRTSFDTGFEAALLFRSASTGEG